MNAVTKEEALALSLPERAAVALGAAEHEVKLRELVQQSAAIVAVTNKAGREECHSAYMKLKTTRVNIGHKVNEVTEDAKLFTKAVKTEAERLVGIMVAEEDRLQALRDAWDEAEQARKDALIAAERARLAAIQDDIQAIRNTPAGLAGANSGAIRNAIALIEEIDATEARFAELTADAQKVLTDTIERLVAMLDAATTAEEAAAKAEADKQAELKAIVDQKAEQARVAAAQAAKEKELVDAAAELQRQRDKDAATARAAQLEVDRLAKVEADKVAAANAAAAKVIADAAADLAAKQAAFQKQQDDAAAASALSAEMEKHYDAALAEDAARTAARIAEKQAMADEAVAAGHDQAADERIAGLPAGALGFDALADSLDTYEKRRRDVLECAMKSVADTFGLTHPEALEELETLTADDFYAARTLAEAA